MSSTLSCTNSVLISKRRSLANNNDGKAAALGADGLVGRTSWHHCGAFCTDLQMLRRIVLPQAMRVIVPPTGNETISMLKTSSLAAYISVSELLFNVQIIYSRNYRVIELLIVLGR